MKKRDLMLAFFVNLIAMIIVAGISGNAYAGDSTPPYWIYLSDKGKTGNIDSKLAQYRTTLPARAIHRRTKTLSPVNPVELQDLPVNEEYIAELEKIDGFQIRHRSRWLNAVSANLTQSAKLRATELDFVERIERVRTFVRNAGSIFERENPHVDDDGIPRRDWNIDYGHCLRQNLFMNIPELHDRGYSGDGILIGLLDAGFNNLDHDCFENLDVLATWDFVNDDENVADQEDDRGAGEHGTKTLSIVAGFEEGDMIGMAYGATYVLAKTEDTEWERPVEEDHWVAGIEWMDELGVEVASSSLSYVDWYDYEDMDGETGVTTIAAQRAVEVGIVIISSMGNTGRNRYPANKMGAPSDGIDVYSIGATNQDSSLAIFSSQGPTYDGRIKPDFTTIGNSVRFASDRNDDVYGAGSGTSFSAPAIAGLCALLLEAAPQLTPLSLRDVLREVSDRSEEPDTLFGWGIPDGLEALNLVIPGEEECTVSLSSGWNMISANVQPIMVHVPDLFEPLVQDGILTMVKDGDGQFYHPEFDFCNIPFWNALEGYQVRVEEDAELVLEGVGIRHNLPINLNEGWQIVSYLPDFEMQPETAFSSLLQQEALLMVKDGLGRFYIPAFNFNNIPACIPAQGYQVKLSQDAVLRYPRIRAGE